MIYSVVGSNQLRRLTRKVKQADPQAFVNVTPHEEKLDGEFLPGPEGLNRRKTGGAAWLYQS